jgi:hypothetical protein
MHCGPASGMAGDRGGDLAGLREQRRALPVRSSSGRRSRAARRSQSPRSPGTGGPPVSIPDTRAIVNSAKELPALCFRMELLLLSIVGAVVAVLVAIWWLARARWSRNAVLEERSPGGTKPQFETTMNELRDMRQALRPSGEARPSKRFS